MRDRLLLLQLLRLQLLLLWRMESRTLSVQQHGGG
jgi:hypothetical protein